MTRPPRRLLAASCVVAVVGALPVGCGSPTARDPAGSGPSATATATSVTSGARASASPDGTVPSPSGGSVPAPAAPTSPGVPTSPTSDPGATSSGVPASPTSDPGATSSDAATTPAAAEFGVAFPGPDWTRPDGSAADTRYGMNLVAGSDHCDWDHASLLHVPWPLDVEVRDVGDLRQYVWDPRGQLEGLGITRDREVGDVPEHAAATGFATAHQQLWLGDDAGEFAYLVGDDDVVRRLERPVVEPGGVLACE